MSTLRFGTRAKQVKNIVRVNQRRSVEELESMILSRDKAVAVMKGYISRLERKLEELVVSPAELGDREERLWSSSAQTALLRYSRAP